MPPTRGHDLKPNGKRGTTMPFPDAPHTGARLETCHPPRRCGKSRDAPHTGARLETYAMSEQTTKKDAPHTGARLETERNGLYTIGVADAPHTGARLETLTLTNDDLPEKDAPHTGARLETLQRQKWECCPFDAPHTGARLETTKTNSQSAPKGMPPTRGHDLKLPFVEHEDAFSRRCPPHGGTT